MPTQRAGTVPKGILIGAAILVVVSITAAATARITGISQDKPQSTPVMTRVLRFEDRPNGAIAVIDAQTSKPADVLAPETNGFIRATLRAMASKRRLAGIDSVDFKLTAWADGRLTLDDPASGGLIELAAFGHTNEEAFARLLTAGKGAKGAAK